MNTLNLTKTETATLSSTISHQDLLQNLSQFGLCPFDWTIDFKNKDEAVIKNNSESDFQFIGKANPTKKNWEYLKLLSL